MNEGSEAQAQGPERGGESANDGPSAGAMLRRAREASGLHVAALAVSLKVPVRKLEALEDDRHDLLTDAVFVRALASSVCRALKIDAQPILARLPQKAAPRLMRRSESLNQPFRGPRDGAPPTWLEQLSRPVFLAVFALLLGALVLILLPQMQHEGAAPAANAVTVLPAQPPVVPSVPATTDAATAVVSPAATPAASTPAVAASGDRAPASSGAAAPVPAAAAAATSTGPVAAASGLVVIRTKGPSWVEVTDARGVVAVSKVLEAGETAGASGALPLRVTIGRVDSTEVHVRGKRFDLRPVSRDNVARFEIK